MRTTLPAFGQPLAETLNPLFEFLSRLAPRNRDCSRGSLQLFTPFAGKKLGLPKTELHPAVRGQFVTMPLSLNAASESTFCAYARIN